MELARGTLSGTVTAIEGLLTIISESKYFSIFVISFVCSVDSIMYGELWSRRYFSYDDAIFSFINVAQLRGLLLSKKSYPPCRRSIIIRSWTKMDNPNLRILRMKGWKLWETRSTNFRSYYHDS